MAFLSACIGVLDSAGERVDVPPPLATTAPPFFLKFDSTITTSCATDGGTNTVTIGVTSGLYALAATLMIAGAGLTGGGSLAADRTFNVGAGNYITVAADAVSVDGTVAQTANKVVVRDTLGEVRGTAFDLSSVGSLLIGGTFANAIGFGQSGVGVTFHGSTITGAAATNFTMQYGGSTRLVLTSPGASITGTLVVSTAVHSNVYDRGSAGQIVIGGTNATSLEYGNANVTEQEFVIDTAGGFAITDGATAIYFGVNAAGYVLGSPAMTWDAAVSAPSLTQDTTVSATGGALSIAAQAAATTGGALNATGGAGTTLGGAVNITGGGATTTGGAVNISGGAATLDGSVNIKGAAVTMLEVGEISARRFVALCVGGQLSSSELLANAGDRVVWLDDAATAPTAAPGAGGLVLFAEGNALKAVNSSGTIRTLHGAGNTTHAAEVKRIIHDDATVNTTNNTITAIVALALPDDTTTTIEAVTMARRTDGGGVANAGYYLRSTFEKAGGVATLTAINAVAQENAGAAAYNGTISVSGAGAAITGLGGTGETVEWYTVYTVRYRS